MRLSNFIGTHLLEHDNARVSAPPGRVRPNGRRNIIIASPMRSGTHLAIDLVLNNLPDYRRRPLYVDLDRLARQNRFDLTELSRAGYVMKTHFPRGNANHDEVALRRLINTSVVVTARRPTEEVRASLARWVAAEPHLRGLRAQLERLDDEIAAFDTFWSQFSPHAISFQDLFRPDKSAAIIAEISQLAGTPAPVRSAPATPQERAFLVYLNKGMTRLLGRRAPRIDTTIHTMH